MLLNIDLTKTDPLVPLANVVEFKDLVKKNFGEWDELYDTPTHYPCHAIFIGNIWNAEEGNCCVFAFIYTK